MNIFKISITKRYIPAVILIAIFIIITNLINSNAISQNEEYAKIINISGKQRMLSLKLLIQANTFLEFQDKKSKKYLKDTIEDIKSKHKYLLTKLFSDDLSIIYYDDYLDKNINEYLFMFEKLIDTKDSSYLKSAKISIPHLVKQLDLVVQEYEYIASTQLEEMTDYEYYLTVCTLFLLLLEVLFIYRPASKEIEKNERELKSLNENLENKVKEQTRDLMKNAELVSTYVIYSKTNLRGIITEVSDAFCEISGYKREDLIGKPHNIIRHLDMESAVFKDVWSTIKQNGTWKGEVKNLRKDNTYYWTSAIITPEYNDKNEPIGYVAIRHDITAKKDFEQQNELLAQSEKMVSMGEMIGNIAHQWRQPLSSISSHITSIQMQKEVGILDDEFFFTTCKAINNNAQYLSKTIDIFRDFIKGEKVYKNIIIQDEISQALGIITATIKDNQILLEDRINYENKVEIYMTTGELPQVIINIINNAKDILLENKIKNPNIILDMIKEENNLIISIEDNAGGVPQDIISKIFEPYFTTKHQSQGTGLGLHMSFEIITKSLNGKLYVKNTSMGAKFFIELPINKS
ncbi:MAG TPA: PAS domain S-box protein [Arcobacter sp.]|nr:PAS domain S-box protein [Arcobacter sp.]